MILSSLFNSPIKKFDHIISLGQTCMLAYQIKRYFGIDHSYLFDYKYTTVATATKIIAEDFKDMLKPENLKLSADQKFIIDQKYHLEYFHDFRDEKNIIPEDYIKRLPEVKSKTEYLTNKLRKILDSKDTCLFINARNPLHKRKKVDKKQALQLEKAIRYRAPKLKFMLAFIDSIAHEHEGKIGKYSFNFTYNESLALADREYQEKRLKTIEIWKGSDLVWDHLFQEKLLINSDLRRI